MTKVGNRVGAICGVKSDEESKIVHFFGYGTYEGEHCPPDNVYFMGFSYAEFKGRTNPKIKLDNGDIVYGCECWWGPEENIKKQLEEYKKKGYTIETVSIVKYRETAKAMAEVKNPEGEVS